MFALKPPNDNGPVLWALGPTPPPVTGMTLLTERVLEEFRRTGPLRYCNWSHGTQRLTLRAKAKRVLRTLVCLAKLVRNGVVQDGRLYLVSNSRRGLILTALLVATAIKLNYRVYLHHHTYGYIDRYNRWMAWINRRMGRRGVHVVHCDQMVRDFCRQYETGCQFETIYPSVVSVPIQEPRLAPAIPFRLGMLSNLTVAKGVGLAIDTFAALRMQDINVELHLAGPFGDSHAGPQVARALEMFPGRVHYHGSVYGEAKAAFLGAIDALLFPTCYSDESWGIVLNEALAAALPVITFDRGCTRSVVGENAGLVVPRRNDYVAAALPQIRSWIACSERYHEASIAAVQQAHYLETTGRCQLTRFASRIYGPVGD